MTHTIYTYGYLAGTRDHPAAAMAETHALLLDTRLVPSSRRPEWRRRSLEDFGPNYLWLRELGNLNYRAGGPIVLADEDAGLKRAAGILSWRPIILLCACKEAARCHRSVVADLLAARTGAPVVHLEGKR